MCLFPCWLKEEKVNLCICSQAFDVLKLVGCLVDSLAMLHGHKQRHLQNLALKSVANSQQQQQEGMVVKTAKAA